MIDLQGNVKISLKTVKIRNSNCIFDQKKRMVLPKENLNYDQKELQMGKGIDFKDFKVINSKK
jgi:hypothetical protein